MKTIPFLARVCGLALLGAFTWSALNLNANFATTYSVKNNLIRTGKIALLLNPADAWLTADALLPGQQVQSTVQVTNSGSQPARVSLSARKAAGYTTIYSALHASVASGDRNAFDDNFDKLVNVVIEPELAAGATGEWTVTVSLPVEAGNELMDSYANLTFDVTAEQI